ncbi:MAG: ECF transporter S component [Oscillospiraceae bacterium]|nr:ECF transporter S component [Oscillospiraceae bacterium]
MQNTSTRKKTLFLAQFSLLLAIEAIVCFTPLGSILAPVMVGTLSHIPVIATAILLGWKAGAVMGFFFGTFSFLVFSFVSPGVMSFVFTPFHNAGDEFPQGNGWSLVICFVPRILIGVVTGLVYDALKKHDVRSEVTYALPAILGSLTNTVLVLGGIWRFFAQPFLGDTEYTAGAMWAVLSSIVLTNGIPEAVAAWVVGLYVCKPLKKFAQ